MQTQNRVLDDLARLVSGAAGVAAGMKDEVQAQFRQRAERLLAELDLVPREEFEAVKEMATKARAEQELLAERVAALEDRLPASPKKTPRRRSAPTRRTTRRATGSKRR